MMMPFPTECIPYYNIQFAKSAEFYVTGWIRQKCSRNTLVTIHFITYLLRRFYCDLQNETKRFSIGVDLMVERFAAFKFQEIPNKGIRSARCRKKNVLFSSILAM